MHVDLHAWALEQWNKVECGQTSMTTGAGRLKSFKTRSSQQPAGRRGLGGCRQRGRRQVAVQVVERDPAVHALILPADDPRIRRIKPAPLQQRLSWSLAANSLRCYY